MDTDTLLALLASLLDVQPDDTAVLLEVLVECDGDVQRAAQILNARDGAKKRKREDGLESWLQPLASKSSKDNASDSPAKPTVQLPKTVPRPPPLTLATPSLVARHTTCTLHLSVLPPELACKLFYTMIDEARDWKRNKWWLFDRLVESPHRTSFYSRKDNGVDGDQNWQRAAQYWYNGRRTEPPPTFPPAMEEACDIIEHVVNAEMHKRKRFPLEWGGSTTDAQIWRANVAASNCYEGAKESVGYHSDQMTYLGPYATIASLSLGTRRIFRLREVIPTDEVNERSPQTFNIPLPHNSLIIMHASTQEKFKHSIPPQHTIDLFHPPLPRPSGSNPPETMSATQSNCRINITFRFYRPDFRPSTTPKCHCGVPTILRTDMKRRNDAREIEGLETRYWWTCYAAVQNEGKGCKYWKVMDMAEEKRGPVVGSMSESGSHS